MWNCGLLKTCSAPLLYGHGGKMVPVPDSSSSLVKVIGVKYGPAPSCLGEDGCWRTDTVALSWWGHIHKTTRQFMEFKRYRNTVPESIRPGGMTPRSGKRTERLKSRLEADHSAGGKILLRLCNHKAKPLNLRTPTTVRPYKNP